MARQPRKTASPPLEPPRTRPGAAANKPDWTRRWAMIRAILGFCAVLIAYLIALGPDDRLRETALLGLLTLSGSVALGYLGFAVQDDRHWRDVVARRDGQGGR